MLEEFYFKMFLLTFVSRSLKVKETALGHDHPVVAVTYMNLGTLEMYRDNVEKNLEYVSEAARIYEVPSCTVNEPRCEKTGLRGF